MRTLTEAEARVIAAMLASSTQGERDRLRRLRVPRSTYHAARRRAYAEGWLRDRYVPTPTPFGWQRIRFALARPYADRFGELLDAWSQDPGCVVLWGSSQAVVGVFFHRDVRSAVASERESVSRGQTAWGVTVIADPRVESIPVYFDFEGAWGHLSGAAGTLSYPHGLGAWIEENPDADHTELAPADPRKAWAAAELLHRPFTSRDGGGAPHLVGPLGLAWSQQRLLATGWVTHRVLLDPARVPPFAGRTPDQVVWITGRVRPGTAPERLFDRLTRECRVFPFLYVVGDGLVLLGALGQAPGTTPEPSHDPGEAPRGVMSALKDSLESIELVQEGVGQMEYRVDHRYDRLMSRRPT